MLKSTIKCVYEREYFLGGTNLEHVAVEKDLDQPRFKLESSR